MIPIKANRRHDVFHLYENKWSIFFLTNWKKIDIENRISDIESLTNWICSFFFPSLLTTHLLHSLNFIPQKSMARNKKNSSQVIQLVSNGRSITISLNHMMVKYWLCAFWSIFYGIGSHVSRWPTRVEVKYPEFEFWHLGVTHLRHTVYLVKNLPWLKVLGIYLVKST